MSAKPNSPGLTQPPDIDLGYSAVRIEVKDNAHDKSSWEERWREVGFERYFWAKQSREMQRDRIVWNRFLNEAQKEHASIYHAYEEFGADDLMFVALLGVLGGVIGFGIVVYALQFRGEVFQLVNRAAEPSTEELRAKLASLRAAQTSAAV